MVQWYKAPCLESLRSRVRGRPSEVRARPRISNLAVSGGQCYLTIIRRFS